MGMGAQGGCSGNVQVRVEGSLTVSLPVFSLEFSRRWCVLSDGVLSYYENERAVTPNGGIRASEIVCLAVPTPDTHG